MQEFMKTYPTVTIWNEYRQEQSDPIVQAVYPHGIHAPIAAHLHQQHITTHIATLDQPQHGLTDALLDQTDILIWWGHRYHHEVDDVIVDRVYKRITSEGMGLIVLHSAHFSKIFCQLMGTTCKLKHAVRGEQEQLWCVDPTHPIAAHLPEKIAIPQTEMYGEFFDIPSPDQLVFISSFDNGEVFRSGCCWQRGMGKIFYFRPGHETYPIYYQPEVLQIITNAVYWALPSHQTVTYGREGRDW